MLAEATRSLPIGGVWTRCYIPDWGHRQVVNMADLAYGEQAAVVPVTGFHGLPIHPASSVRVSLDLVVLSQRLSPYGPALDQEHLYLAQDQRVTFQRGGVMCFLMPDVSPNRLG